jgi:hypothetical protein
MKIRCEIGSISIQRNFSCPITECLSHLTPPPTSQIHSANFDSKLSGHIEQNCSSANSCHRVLEQMNASSSSSVHELPGSTSRLPSSAALSTREGHISLLPKHQFLMAPRYRVSLWIPSSNETWDSEYWW